MGVYKKRNRWYIDYYLPGGKRKREVVTINGVNPSRITRHDALKALSVRIAEIAEGKFNIAHTNSRPILFEKLAHTFLEDYSKVNKKSWKRDRTSCRALLKYFQRMNINQITPWHVDKYKSSRLKDVSRLNKPISKASINRELACLKKMLSYAVGESWLHSNPLRGYKLFNEPPKKFRVISKEEFQLVYNQASTPLKLALLIAYCTGMRQGEILNLKWENLDLDEGYILVTESKNGESRYVTLNQELKVVLENLEQESKAEFVISRDGFRVKSIRTAFENAVKKSGVDWFTFHDLRHTYASNLIMEGVDIVTVQELLGHKTITMTKRYSHPTLEHKKRAAEKISADVLDPDNGNAVISFNKQINENI